MTIQHTCHACIPAADIGSPTRLCALHGAAPDLLAACTLIVGVGDCMMMNSIHASWAVKEILEKHGFDDVQLMAKAAEDTARAAIAKAKGEPGVTGS